VVIGKDSLGKDKLITQIQGKGYTNETAIETRIIDREVLGENGVARDDDEERKAVTKDFMKRKTEEKKIEDSNSDEESDDDDEDSNNDIDENNVEKAIHKAEEDLESKDGSDEEVGYGFIDDEQVSSEDDDETDDKA